jgi:hypothetical protein
MDNTAASDESPERFFFCAEYQNHAKVRGRTGADCGHCMAGGFGSATTEVMRLQKLCF